jgi:hypothetical protein
LAHITLPPETAEKLYYGQPLSDDEKQAVARLPIVVERLLAHIPRLENVRAILAKAAEPYHRIENALEGTDKHLIVRCAQILKVALDFDALEVQGNSAEFVIDTLRGRKPGYHPETLEAFAILRCSAAQKDEVRELPLSAIREGMVLAQDLKLTNGTLLAARGYEITTSFVERVQHFRPGHIKGLVRVVVRGGAT